LRLIPSNSHCYRNVVAEVSHQVKRLASHPSIAIWAGNNENEGGLSQNIWGIQDLDQYKNDYIKLYVNTIEREVLRILPNATFITSSPTNGADSVEENFIAENPGDELYGDGSAV
jgi:beta-mannosidase